MKKSILLLVVLSLIAALPASAQVKFKDVPDDHWAADAVYDLVSKGITTGYPDGTFRGSRNISRYENAALLSRLLKSIEGRPEGGVSEAQVSRMIDEALAKKMVPSEGTAVSGTIFVRYLKGLTNSTVINNFDIDRAYVTIKKQLNNNANAKVVLDSGRQTGKLETFVKYAYVDLNNVIAMDGFNMDIRIGAQPTFWSPWVDKILGLRVVASSMVGLDGGITTSDFGAGTLGSVDLMGVPVNYLLTALNGSSFAAAEANAAKNIAGRVDSEVMPGIIVGVGGQVADVESDGDYGTRVVTGIVAYKTEPAKAYLEALYGMGALGVSAAGSYDLGALQDVMQNYGVFGRVDVWDPDRSVDEDGWNRFWAGVTYKWNDNVKLVGDYMATVYADSAAINAGETVSQVALRTQIDL